MKKIKKATKGVNVLRKRKLLLSSSSVLAIYRSFTRSHLDDDYVIYLSDKIETVQNNGALAITSNFRETSKGKLHQELGV